METEAELEQLRKIADAIDGQFHAAESPEDIQRIFDQEVARLAAPPTGSLPKTVAASDGTTMILIDAGSFEMGSDGENDEKPTHTVTLDNFYIDQYEVTNAQYRQCVEDGTCQAPSICDDRRPTYGDANKEDHPVVCVSWISAKTYCAENSAQLVM